MNQLVYLYVAGIVFLAFFGLKLCDWVRAVIYTWKKQIATEAFAEGYAYGCIRSKVITVTPDRPADAWLRAANAEAEAIMTDVSWWGEAQ
jgi:hypothetical protein